MGGGGEGSGLASGTAAAQMSPETLFRKSHPSERSHIPSSQPLLPVGNGHAKALPVRSQPWFPLWPEMSVDEAKDAGTVPDSWLFCRWLRTCIWVPLSMHAMKPVALAERGWELTGTCLRTGSPSPPGSCLRCRSQTGICGTGAAKVRRLRGAGHRAGPRILRTSSHVKLETE